MSQQLWLTGRITGSLNPKLKVNVENEGRYDKESTLYTHQDFGVSYKIFKPMSVSINYRNIYTSDSLSERRPHISTTFKYWGIGLKPRLEFRIKDELSCRFRLRGYYKKDVSEELKLYFADEIFVSNVGLNGNRLYPVGIIYTNKIVDIMGYYLIESKLGDEWKHYHIFGLSLRLNFVKSD